MTKNVYNDFEMGDLQPHQITAHLLNELGEIASEIAPLEAEERKIREQLSHVVVRHGTQVVGDTRVLITSPSVSYSYDTKKLDEYLLSIAADYPEIVAAISRYRKFTERSGSLQIRKEK